MRDMDIFHTASGQNDPTAGAALSKLIFEEALAERLEKEKLQKVAEHRNYFTPTTTLDPYRELANTIIAVAYRDYVDVLRKLEKIPEPPSTADEKTLAKHQKRIAKLKEEMEEIEEFFYSPLFELACNIHPDTLVNQAWEEAYK